MHGVGHLIPKIKEVPGLQHALAAFEPMFAGFIKHLRSNVGIWFI
jgi:hypothetical protein